MKKLFTAIACCIIIFTTSAALRNNIFLVHHTDGTFDAFLYNEIDSIRYSNFGLDSMAYSEVMTQEIWTADSVYRYAITDIDSVCFQMPQTIEKENAINLANADIEQYIISSDSSTIFFKSTTPDELMPKVGSRLYAIHPSEKLPYGFLGEVTSITTDIDKTKVACKETEITDVFTQFYGGITAIGNVNPTSAQDLSVCETKIGTEFEIDTVIPPININKSFPFTINDANIELSELPFGTKKIGGTLEYSNECALDLTLNMHPHVKISYIWAINPLTTYERGKISISADYDFSITGKISSTFNIQTTPIVNLTIPIGLGTKFVFPVGFFLAGEATAGFEYNYSNSAKLFTDISSTRPTLPLPGILPSINGNSNLTVSSGEHSIDFSLSGSIRGGMFIEPGIALIHEDFLKLGLYTELGMELSGNSLFYTSDILDAQDSPALYLRLLEENGISLLPYSSLQCNVKILGQVFEIGPEIKHNFPSWLEINPVPKFSQPHFTNNGDGTATISYNIDGQCLSPKKVGILITDRDGIEPSKTIFFEDKYFNQDLSYSQFSTTFNYDGKSRYKIHPIVEISPQYNYLMGVPAWPPIDGNIFYPFIYHQENQAAGISATSGMTNIESAADNGTSLQEGNYFPFNEHNTDTEK